MVKKQYPIPKKEEHRQKPTKKQSNLRALCENPCVLCVKKFISSAFIQPDANFYCVHLSTYELPHNTIQALHYAYEAYHCIQSNLR